MIGMLKKIFAALVVLTVSEAVFALPGVVPYLPDISGEYVYYRDNSFESESYVGFLYYDESTYAVRYYSPLDEKLNRLEKNIIVYFSVNTQKNLLEFTGEKIEGIVVEEDAEIVNYIHDLFYEFTSRRQHATSDFSKPFVSDQEFFQFGGNVKICFSSYVPIFNIESIEGSSGKRIFDIVTVGCLVSSQDTSFHDFKGNSGIEDKKRNCKIKKAKPMNAEFEGMKITLDENWKSDVLPNVYFLGENAVATFNKIASPGENNDKAQDYLVRKIMQGANHSYVLWQHGKVTADDGRISIMNLSVEPENGNVSRSFVYLKQNEDGSFSHFVLTSFEGVYQKNRKYFNKMLKSYCD